MVRTRTFDPSAALSKAVNLFASKGYAETSMDDIVKATGVSRYGLYGTFGNKRELFEQALERYAEGMGKKSFLRLLEPGASLDHIRAIFDERIADIYCGGENKGCLFIHTAMELAPQDDELRGVLQRFMKRISKAFSIGLDSAKGRGEIRDDVDVDETGDLLTSTLFGLAVLVLPRQHGETHAERVLAGRVDIAPRLVDGHDHLHLRVRQGRLQLGVTHDMHAVDAHLRHLDHVERGGALAPVGAPLLDQAWKLPVVLGGIL